MSIQEQNKKNKLDIIKNKYKDKDKQIIKSDSSLTTENNLLNELKESNDSTIINNMLNNKRKKNKHKSGYMEELSQEKNLLETREERLEKIRKKYLYENQNNEINELNTNEEMTKGTDLINDNLINEKEINNVEDINENKEEIQNEENIN